MKTLIIVAIVVLLTAIPVAAQNDQYAPEPVRERLNTAPRAFRTFFAKFRSAVERNKRSEVAAMTRFPFAYGYDAGDEGTYSRAQFLKNWKHVTGDFFGDYKMERNPVFSRDTDGTFIISTDSASHLNFRRSGKTWKFVAYVVEP